MMEGIHIAMLKKKSDAKSFNKAINKHGLDAQRLLPQQRRTWEPRNEHNKKMTKTIPGSKDILRAVSSNNSSLNRNRDESNGHSNVHITRKRDKRLKKHATA